MRHETSVRSEIWAVVSAALGVVRRQANWGTLVIAITVYVWYSVDKARMQSQLEMCKTQIEHIEKVNAADQVLHGDHVKVLEGQLELSKQRIEILKDDQKKRELTSR